MANIKSAAKKARQAIVRRDRNQQAKKAVRSLEKKVRLAAAAKKSDETKSLLTEYASKMGKAAQKGMYHANTASRKVSRLAQFVNKTLTK